MHYTIYTSAPYTPTPTPPIGRYRRYSRYFHSIASQDSTGEVKADLLHGADLVYLQYSTVYSQISSATW